MSLALPLIAWGTAEAIGSWSNSGTPIVTTGQTDPFGGTAAVLIEDDDGAASEAKTASVGAYASTSMILAAMAKAGTAGASVHLLRDTTAAASRGGFTFTWSGGVPVVTGLLATTPLGTVALGGGWYLALGVTTGLTSGNVHERRCYGANLSGTSTGSTYWYLRNLVLLDYLDDPMAFTSPRQGQWATSASGVPDSWIPGTDYRLKGRVRWVPTTPQSFPVLASGWDGRNEAVGINAGVQAMLTAGRNKQVLTFVPDRSTCTANIDSYLAAPMREAPTLESTGGPYRTFPLELRNASTAYPVGL